MTPEMKLKFVTVVRTDLKIRKGKFGAQFGHAVQYLMETFLLPELLFDAISENKWKQEVGQWFDEWRLDSLSTKITVGISSLDELKDLEEKAKAQGIPIFPVTDVGATEFHGVKTQTCTGFGPAPEDLLNTITGHLKLL